MIKTEPTHFGHNSISGGGAGSNPTGDGTEDVVTVELQQFVVGNAVTAVTAVTTADNLNHTAAQLILVRGHYHN